MTATPQQYIDRLQTIIDQLKAGENPSFVMFSVVEEHDDSVEINCCTHVNGLNNRVHLHQAIEENYEKTRKTLTKMAMQQLLDSIEEDDE